MRAVVCMLALTTLTGCDDFLLPTGGEVGPVDSARVADILALTGDPVAGETVFADHCELCHDASGQDTIVGPPLDPWIDTSTDEDTLAVILEGKGAMVGFSELTDTEIADLLAWLHDSFDD